jgi:type II secretory pathway component PulM
VNELLAPLRRYLAGRSARERWLLVAGACVIAFLVVYLGMIVPLQEGAAGADQRVVQLEGERARALRIAAEMREIQGELASSKRRSSRARRPT